MPSPRLKAMPWVQFLPLKQWLGSYFFFIIVLFAVQGCHPNLVLAIPLLGYPWVWSPDRLVRVEQAFRWGSGDSEASEAVGTRTPACKLRQSPEGTEPTWVNNHGRLVG